MTNSAPKNLLSGTQLTPVIDSVSNVSSIVLAASKCYYSGGCQLGCLQRSARRPVLQPGCPPGRRTSRWVNTAICNSSSRRLICSIMRTMGTISDSQPMGSRQLPTPHVVQLARNRSQRRIPRSRTVGFINPSSSLLPRAFTAEFGSTIHLLKQLFSNLARARQQCTAPVQIASLKRQRACNLQTLISPVLGPAARNLLAA